MTHTVAGCARVAHPCHVPCSFFGFSPPPAREAGQMMYPGGCNHQIGGPPAKLLPWQHDGAASQRRQQPPWSSTVVDFLTLSARMNVDFGPIQLLCSVPTLYHHTIWPDLSAACRRRLESWSLPQLFSLGFERHKERPVTEPLSTLC